MGFLFGLVVVRELGSKAYELKFMGTAFDPSRTTWRLACILNETWRSHLSSKHLSETIETINDTVKKDDPRHHQKKLFKSCRPYLTNTAGDCRSRAFCV